MPRRGRIPGYLTRISTQRDRLRNIRALGHIQHATPFASRPEAWRSAYQPTSGGNHLSLIRPGPRPPLIAAAGDSIHALSPWFTELNVGAAAVLEGDRLVGVITERDVIKHVVAPERKPREIRIGDVMSSPVITVDLKTTITAAVSIVRARHIRHLVVVDDEGKGVGMPALRYLLYAVTDAVALNVGDMTRYILLDNPGG